METRKPSTVAAAMAIPSQQQEQTQEEGDEGAAATDTPDVMEPAAGAAGAAPGPGEEEEEASCTREGEDADDTANPVAMFRELYSVLFEHEGAGRGRPTGGSAEEPGDEDEPPPPPSALPSPMCTPPRCHGAVGAGASGSSSKKRVRLDDAEEREERLCVQSAVACGSLSSSSSSSSVSLAHLPDECLQEVASYLPAPDLWPTLALVCRRISHNPSVVPVLMEACPPRARVGALFRFAEASGAAEAAAELAPLAPPCQKMLKLELSGLPLGDHGGQRLARAVERGAFPAVRSLCLRASGCGRPTFEALAGAMLPSSSSSSPPKVEELPAAAAAAAPTGAGALSRALTVAPMPRAPATQALRSLCFFHNGMGDRGLDRLARALAGGGCPRLQSLQLAGCGVGETGVAALAAALGSGRCGALRRLDVSENPRIGQAGGILLMGGLRGVGGIEELKLRDCGLGELGARALAQALEAGALHGLTLLNLAANGINGPGMEALAEAWVHVHDHRDCYREEQRQQRRQLQLSLAPPMTFLERSDSVESAASWSCHDGDDEDGDTQQRQQPDGDDAPAPPMLGLRRSDSSSSSSSSSPTGPCLPLAQLDLGRNRLGARGAEALAELFRRGIFRDTLRALALPANDLGSAAAAVIFDGLRAGAGAGAGDDDGDNDGAAAAAPLPWAAMEELDLGHNHLEAGGAAVLARCIARGAFPRLTRLDVSDSYMGAEGCRHMSRALATGRAPSLRQLSLAGCALGDQGMAHLSEALQAQACPALEHLDLSRDGLGDTGAAALALAVGAGSCDALRGLALRGNELQAEGLRALALALRGHCPRLHQLDLGCAPPPSQEQEEEDADALAAAVAAPAGGGGIQALGAYFLAAVLSDGAAPQLRRLQLGGQAIGRSGAYMLHICIRNGALRQLEALDLTGSQGIRDMGLSYLAIAFRRGGCPRLTSLGLADCGVGDAGLRHLAHAFGSRREEGRRLEALELGGNRAITGDGLAHLCHQARAGAFPRLRRLGLGGCQVGDQGLASLGEACRAGAFDGLRELHLGHAGVHDGGLAAWVDGVLGTQGEGELQQEEEQQQQQQQQQPRRLALQSLTLSGNHLTGFAIGRLAELLAAGACPKLTCLRLADNALGDFGALRLARLLAGKRCPLLREVDLSRNHIDDEGVSHLVGALGEGGADDGAGAALRRLSLAGNKLGEAATQLLRQLVESNRCPLLTDCGV